MAAPRPRYPILLIVIDGWGQAPPGPHNAIHLASAPTMTMLARDYPSTLLEASGGAVGLPQGQMGNSEVGHLNIGAGRVVDQDFVRITRACREGRIGSVPAIAGLLSRCRTEQRPLHVLGLLGPGGVHSHEEHLYALLNAAKEARVPRTWVHHVLDGRDTPPQSALDFIRRAQQRIDAAGARVATVSGRYWTMDRDKRWERTESAYRMLTHREGHTASDAANAVELAYGRGETDEFVRPTIVGHADPIRPGDGVLVYNFRPDRVRQIVRALADPAFQEFPALRPAPHIVGLTQYDATFAAFGVQTAYPPHHPKNTLGEAYAHWGLKQLRIAETEKYAHVTYFFSGGRETPFDGEDRLLVPSPKVATYDLQPAMSAHEVTARLLEALPKRYDLVVLNFANPDMVGHTGKLTQTVEACRVVDDCIRRLFEAFSSAGYLVAVTADHGNAESMVDAQGRPWTAHTTNLVPFILAHADLRGSRLRPGAGLSSVAPTLLAAVGLARPSEMAAPNILTPPPVVPGSKPTPA